MYLFLWISSWSSSWLCDKQIQLLSNRSHHRSQQQLRNERVHDKRQSQEAIPNDKHLCVGVFFLYILGHSPIINHFPPPPLKCFYSSALLASRSASVGLGLPPYSAKSTSRGRPGPGEILTGVKFIIRRIEYNKYEMCTAYFIISSSWFIVCYLFVAQLYRGSASGHPG